METETGPVKLRRPLSEVLPISKEVVDILGPWCRRIEIGGSIRRRASEVGDIEVVAIPRKDEAEAGERSDLFLVPTKVEVNLLWDGLARAGHRARKVKGGQRYRQFVWDDGNGPGIVLDGFTADESNWGWIYLVRTGSAEFSRHVAGRLNLRGYTSMRGRVHRRDWAGHPIGEPIPTPTEEDVFGLAGIRPIRAERRSWA